MKFAFFTDHERFDPKNFTEYNITDKSQIITLNKILQIRDAETSKILIKGTSDYAFDV